MLLLAHMQVVCSKMQHLMQTKTSFEGCNLCYTSYCAKGSEQVCRVSWW